MNSLRQFWVLLMFQVSVNRRACFLITFLFLHLFVINLIQVRTSDLYVRMANGTALMAWLPVLLLLGSRDYLSQGAQTGGNEFLLTRAVDRNILYRSKAALVAILVLTVPVIIVLFSLRSPDLRATLDPGAEPGFWLNHLPGSSLLAPGRGEGRVVIFIPGGNILIAGWHFWAFCISFLAAQAFLLCLYGNRVLAVFKLPVTWKLLIISVWAIVVWCGFPLLWDYFEAVNRWIFSCFSVHPAAFWLFAVAAVILVQPWCERRFARLEQ